jgi:ribosomal protein S17E
MEENIGPITSSIIEQFILELKKKNTQKEIIDNVAEPMIKSIINKYASYITVIILLLVLTTILQIIILIILTQ